MIRILCAVGIHRSEWVPVLHPIGTAWAPPVRCCHHCGQLLPQRIR